ncbi:MAG: FprA family A-type flavoprotein [Deltaproteobacteria bacterium]|nr:MAG: FprA family A-type flavoprotein [Deltaproteobacteria bacterium]
MGAVQIRDGVYWVGVRDPELAVFDIVIPTEFGTTYNSYLVKGAEKTALIDCVKHPFYGEWFEKIKEVVDPASVDIVVVNHSEPDHSGAIVELLKVNPDVKVYLSKAAKGFVDNIVNGPYNVEVISDGQEVDLGGRKLKFIVAPFLHWPDTIFTYDEESRVLFPCDFLGAHYCTEKVFNDELGEKEREDSVRAFRYYYNTIMRPYKEYILQALEKIKDLPIDVVAPSHGPVLRDDVSSYIEWYRERASIMERKGERKRVAVIYASAYGNTAAMAKKVAEGLEKEGINVRLINTVDVPMNEIIDEIELADGIIFGTSTLNATVPKPILNIISNMVVLNVRGKYFSVFGSYGWSGEAIKMVQDILLTMRLKLVGEPVRVRLAPSEDDLKKCVELGEEFARKVKES